MKKTELIKEIMDSNLKDETKLELVKTLMLSKDEVVTQPPQIPYVIKEVYKETPKPWWSEVTCGDCLSKKTGTLESWDDNSWWQQHLRDAQADVESIIHPNVTWSCSIKTKS